MYCSKCGYKMEESAKFCPSCGASQSNQDVKEALQPSESVNKIVDEAKVQFDKGKQSGNLYKIVGWISMAVSLLFIPVLFGAIAVIMGYLYRSHDEKHGTILMIAGVAGAVLGMLLGMSYTPYY